MVVLIEVLDVAGNLHQLLQLEVGKPFCGHGSNPS